LVDERDDGIRVYVLTHSMQCLPQSMSTPLAVRQEILPFPPRV
jgi:hypothetical protein